jgi:hypothetical protein
MDLVVMKAVLSWPAVMVPALGEQAPTAFTARLIIKNTRCRFGFLVSLRDF